MIRASQPTSVFSNGLRALDSQVARIVEQIAETKNERHECGLLGGKAGIALLFAYLSKLLPSTKYLQATFQILEDLSYSLSTDDLGYNMSAGVAGIAFTFQHLRNIGVLDRRDDMNLPELDEFLSLGIDNDFKNGNWDPLHGMVGLGIYFLERNKETGEKKYLGKIIDLLSLMRTRIEEYRVWITPGYGEYSNDNYNFGMAHGMPGILSFLAQVHAHGIKQKEIAEMISSSLPFLLRHEYQNDNECSFPNSIDVNPKNGGQKHGSRLAWCYGDLCMANTLVHCGKSLDQKDYLAKGIEIAIKTTKRDLESSGCMDAPFCHGTVGLVHQYNRFYRLTGNYIFKYACEKWIDITLEQFYRPGQGVGGYLFRSLNEEKKCFEYTPSYGILEGSAGIALVYLSWLHNIPPNWDIIFLVNV